MALGPVEYIVVAFPGNKFKGEILPALVDLVSGGLIRIIDLVFVRKDVDGSVTVFELEDLPGDEAAPFGALELEVSDLLNEEDVLLEAEALEPDSSAALLVWESLWARSFSDAVRDAGGILVDYDRVPHDIAVAAFAQSTTIQK